MKEKIKTLQIVLMIGALWGITEATVGYALHFLPYGFSGMFMFPIGMYFMYNAYRQSDRKTAVFGVALIAASIKFIDLALPTRSPMSVINPAISILLESLIVYAFVKAYDGKRTVLSIYGMGFAWILLFTLTQALIFRPETGLYTLPAQQIVLFVLLNAAVSGTLMLIYFKWKEKFGIKALNHKVSFAMTVVALIAAIGLEAINSMIF